MSYLVLARKYRPEGFDDFVGQQVIAETLRNAIRLDRVAHAYLFCGPRGVGKTSMARVFAKALNCEKGPTPSPCGKCDKCQAIAAGQDVDVIEIDGASNRGIDDIREIRQNARYVAARSRFKIYVIDEVHMLTEQAFNALLKTLEEPPGHVKFILATTAPAKLPQTILSRVQRFDFRRIANAEIIRKLKEICKAEKVEAPDEVLMLVARRARGSMRDGLSILDQVFSFCGDKPTPEAVAALLGTLEDAELDRIVRMVRDQDAPGLLKAANEFLVRGMDVGEFIDELVGYLRDLLVGRVCGADQDLLDRPADSAGAIVERGGDMTPESILYMTEVLNNARRRIREGQDDRIVLEMALIKLAQSEGLAPVGELLERLAALQGQADIPPPAAGRPAANTDSRVASPSAAYSAPPAAPAAAAKESPPAAPSRPVGDKQDGLWRRVLDAAHGESLWFYAKLAMGHLQRVDEREAIIAFPADRPHEREEMERPDHRRKLAEILAAIIGRPVQVRFVAVAEGAISQTPEEKAAHDEMVQEAIRQFDGQINSAR